MSEVRSYRCTACDANYPATDTYRKCPIHKTETWEAKGERPMEGKEAEAFVAAERRRIRLHAEFETYMVQQAVEEFLTDIQASEEPSPTV